MPGWLVLQPFDCVDCGATFERDRARSVRCRNCQYKHVLEYNKARRHKGPFFFNCGRCGVAVTTDFERQKYCKDCMKVHERELGSLRGYIKRASRPARIVQCGDCGLLIHNAMPTQKRCPGCQELRARNTDKGWSKLSKTGKPINCVECGAPKIAFHPDRKHCDECYKKIRLAKMLERNKEMMRDPVRSGYALYQILTYRREWRAARKRLLKNPAVIESAVVENLKRLGIGGENGS